MGDDDMHREGVGRIPQHGGPKADRETTLDREGWNVDIPPAGGCNGGSGTAGSGNLRLLPPLHLCAVH